MKRVLWVLNRGILLITFAAAIYLASALALSVAYIPAKPVKCDARVTIYLQHSPVHADFVIPREALSDATLAEIILPEPNGYGPPPFLVFGLGDRDIYVNTPTWWDLKPRFALKAMFLPSDRAVHVEPAYRAYEGWIPLEVCKSQIEDLEIYIRDSFIRDDNGRVKELEGLTFTGYDRFYEAIGTYTLFNSCNNWTNNGLKVAGIRTPLWSPFPQGVIHHARRNKAPEQK